MISGFLALALTLGGAAWAITELMTKLYGELVLVLPTGAEKPGSWIIIIGAAMVTGIGAIWLWSDWSEVWSRKDVNGPDGPPRPV
jgi:hypothetical protein